MKKIITILSMCLITHLSFAQTATDSTLCFTKIQLNTIILDLNDSHSYKLELESVQQSLSETNKVVQNLNLLNNNKDSIILEKNKQLFDFTTISNKKDEIITNKDNQISLRDNSIKLLNGEVKKQKVLKYTFLGGLIAIPIVIEILRK